MACIPLARCTQVGRKWPSQRRAPRCKPGISCTEVALMPFSLAPADPKIETETEILERYQPVVALERPHRVVIHNDDVTPMDFVVTVLVGIFDLSMTRASEVMWTAHTTGIAIVCSLPPEEARERVNTA